MTKAKIGDKVRINFTGTLEDGTIFDSTLESNCSHDECDDDCGDVDDCGCGHESGPMELTIGEGNFFPQIEEALAGMAPGETKKLVVPSIEAFGEYDEEKVFEVPRSDMPEDLKPDVGDELTLTGDDGDELEVVVTAVSEESVTFDANHPLAGEDLTFEIELLEILAP